MGTRLTMRRLRALGAAIGAMLAGEEHEGDWPDDVTSADAEAAAQWVYEQIVKRERDLDPRTPEYGVGR